MALTPQEFEIDEMEVPEDVEVVEVESEPSKTWRLDFENGRIGGFIDEEEAIKQFIRKSVSTARERYIIYDEDYGCELFNLFGQSLTTDLIETEIPRYIREALIYDDRIEDVTDITMDLRDGVLYVEITVELEAGEDLTEGVTLYV